jgi:hypothetical protein
LQRNKLNSHQTVKVYLHNSNFPGKKNNALTDLGVAMRIHWQSAEETLLHKSLKQTYKLLTSIGPVLHPTNPHKPNFKFTQFLWMG